MGTPEQRTQHLIAAWRCVVDGFPGAGAANVVWVWAPHVAYAGYEVYWPGDDYVDWVATRALNDGTVACSSEWWGFDLIFGQHCESLAGFGEPVTIAELGSLEVGGDRAGWYREALEGFRSRFPAVKALLFFHVEGDATVMAQPLDWAFTRDSKVTGTVRKALSGDSPAIADEPGA